jgi:precorrin-6B methylase 1
VSAQLDIVGLGPGREGLVTPEASAALEAAEAIYGYGPYLDRVPKRAGQARHASDNRVELDRAQAALTAAETARVAMVSGGDPGVFAMAAAVCEAVEQGPATWRGIAIVVHPGITAMLALAARVGAPLGHDFCAISLSDNLKPWALVERRLGRGRGRLRDGALQPDQPRAALAARRGLRHPARAPAGGDARDLRPRDRAQRRGHPRYDPARGRSWRTPTWRPASSSAPPRRA